jgi:hypothetical protein
MRNTTLTPVLLLAGLTLTACGGWGRQAEPREEELVLRGYAAPGQAESLAEAIARLLILGERRVGTARVGPGEQLLVLAPRSVHGNIGELIRAASESKAPAEQPASIAMTYWFVAGRPVAQPVPAPRGLEEIEVALDEIAGAQGPHEFRLIERLQLRQAPTPRTSTAQSPNLSLRQDVSFSGGHVVAGIHTSSGRNRIETTVELRPAQLLVLGQVALDPALDPFRLRSGRPPGESASAGEKALYLVIRADVDPSG